jgi:hypothetical protein
MTLFINSSGLFKEKPIVLFSSGIRLFIRKSSFTNSLEMQFLIPLASSKLVTYQLHYQIAFQASLVTDKISPWKYSVGLLLNPGSRKILVPEF